MALTEQLAKTEKISPQNANLRKRAVAVFSRATAQTERAIRSIGSDLHDGPGQYLSLASLRLDRALNAPHTPTKNADLVREALAKALNELRIISRGMALPDLDHLKATALIDRAILDHHRQTGLDVSVDHAFETEPELNYAQKLCVFRFLQETLSNATRHAEVDTVRVSAASDLQSFTITVADAGRGFDPARPHEVRSDGGQGLFGLTDRAESIGGNLAIASAPGKGTTLSLTLPFEENAT